MRSKSTLATLLLLTFAALPVTASAPATVPTGADANMPTSITADFQLEISEVRDDSTVVFLDENQAQHVVQLDDTVKIRARKKRDFNGRKKLGLADLRVGQKVKVTVFVADGAIRSITVLERA